jgi:hypothetical protein
VLWRHTHSLRGWLLALSLAGLLLTGLPLAAAMPLRATTLPSPPTSWCAITGPCVTCSRAAMLRPRLAAAPSALPGSQAAAHRGPRPRWQSPASPLISRALHRPASAIGLAARPAPVARRREPRRHDADDQLLLALLLPRTASLVRGQ